MKTGIFTADELDPRNLDQLALPDGLTLEMLDAYAVAHRNAQRRADYAKHPDRVFRQRLRAAVSLLARAGVIDKMNVIATLSWIDQLYPPASKTDTEKGGVNNV